MRIAEFRLTPIRSSIEGEEKGEAENIGILGTLNFRHSDGRRIFHG